MSKIKSKALEGKKTGKSSKLQLYRESIPHLKKMAAEERKKKAPFEKKYGTFEERLKKYEEWRAKLK